MFLEVMPEESKNAPFYQRHGFTLMEDGRAMQIVTRSCLPDWFVATTFWMHLR